ncbi:hypothetical protein BC829DRAFT_161723 [Chytridium lagenaria]|nr:hypothetical protein BC829DRAFT_161723 [Chytridium lagenaria]
MRTDSSYSERCQDLIVLLGSPEVNVCVASVEALTKYAETSSKNRAQLLNTGLIKYLLNLATSKEVAIKKAAAACVAACTELSELHPEMRRKDSLIVLFISQRLTRFLKFKMRLHLH